MYATRASSTRNEDGLLSVMNSLHRAVVDVQFWPAFLENLAMATGARRAVLISLADVHRTGVWASYEFPAHCAQQWQSYYRRVDPWLAALQMPNRGDYAVFRGESLVPDDALRLMKFYTDYLAPNDLRWLRGIWIQPEGAFSSPYAIMLWRGVDQTSFDESVDATLDSVARALNAYERMSVANAISRAGGLDRFDAAAFLLNGAGALLMANPAGAALVNNGVIHDGSRHLTLASVNATQWLQAMIAQGERDPALFGTPIRQRERLPELGNAHLDLYAMKPIGAAPALLGMRYALMIRSETSGTSVAVRRTAQKMYHWTNAEFDTVSRLSSGDALPEIARQRQCTIETVRSHLKNAKRKAGVRRQVDLVRIMAALER